MLLDPAGAVLSGQLLVSIPIALLAGLVSFASPCILPLVPGYLGLVGSLVGRDGSRGRLVAGVSLFIAGF
ncbi:MAG: cytochrome c biogenesis protein CcdA, partial [Actinomycetes bacterium]